MKPQDGPSEARGAIVLARLLATAAAGDTLMRDLYLGRARALLEPTCSEARYRSALDDRTAVQRLLGTSGELGSRLGLDNKWLLQAIKAGGNYGEIFERNVGSTSPLKLERGLNATWSKGGLMYAIPFK